MELSAYIHDAWAYEQAHSEFLDADLLTSDEIDHPKCQSDSSVGNLTMIKWRSYLLSAIAITGMNSFNLSFSHAVEAHQFLEPSVNTAPWCDNLYLCNTSYILEVQTLLVNRGFAVGEIDGVYGRHTKRAVINFQKSQKSLVVDGIPGEKTLALLRNPASDSSVIVSSNRNNQTINNQTIEKSEVGNLQILLKQRGFYQGEIDGQLGASTTEAISRAQQAYSLPPDGFAGPLTMRALLAGGTNIALSLPAFERSPTSKDVMELQQLLQSRGFYNSEINGRFNLQTRESIFNAQNAYGQKATGDLSPELIAALKGQNIDQSTAQNITTPQNNAENNAEQDTRPSSDIPNTKPNTKPSNQPNTKTSNQPNNQQSPTSSQNSSDQSPPNTNSS